MKNMKSKVMVAILSLLMIMLMSTNIEASINIPNYGFYYTREDIWWNSSAKQIMFLGTPYYCINHNYSLGAGLASSTKTNLTSSGDFLTYRERTFTDFTEGTWFELVLEGYKGRLLQEAQEYADSLLEGQNKTFTVTGPSSFDARDELEAAIYAFAKEFNAPTTDVALSIWNYESARGTSAWGGENDLWTAANAYVAWDGPNLVTDDSEAKINVNSYTDHYVVGPFTMSYDTGGGPYNYISFIKNFIFNVRDQDGNTIDGVTYLVDESGPEYPRDENGNPIINGIFYLDFPYTREVTRIDIDLSFDYIESVSGWGKDRYTATQRWEYEVYEEEVGGLTWCKLYHAADCSHVPSTETHIGSWKWLEDDECECSRIWQTGVSVGANLVQLGSDVYGEMQNMRTIDGEVTWNSVSASMSAEVEQDMMIAGHVWEDGKEGKNSTFNGSLDNLDTMLEGIEVRLYFEDGTLVEELDGTNPTLTDANGYYEFTGLLPTEKYYVVFTYDGVIYINTYGAGEPEYNTDAWNASSKGSELISDRSFLNEKFVTIGAYPKAYVVINPIFTDTSYLEIYQVKKYNEVFRADDEELLYYKNLITERLRTYLNNNKTLEDGQQIYVDAIYQPILNNLRGEELIKAKRILQYIWDCRINSYAGYESIRDGKEVKDDQLYPYYDKIILTDRNKQMVTANSPTNINGFNVIYNGQLHVNQGIIKREQTNLSLFEDINKTVVSINGKDEIYRYGTLTRKELGVLASDIRGYEQNIAFSDYNYKNDTTTIGSEATYSDANGRYAPIEVYITYKIVVTNNSMVPTSVNEIATYFDNKYYSYSDSYLTTEGQELQGIEGKYVYNIEVPDEYGGVSNQEVEEQLDIVNVNSDSAYGAMSVGEKGLVEEKKAMYISFDENIILENNESIALYITYRLGEDSTSHSEYSCTYNGSGRGNAAYVILQDLLPEEDSQFTIGTKSEINAFGTYYKKVLDVIETQEKYSDMYLYESAIRPYDKYRAAGVIDVDSMPGNLTQEEVEAERAISQTNKDISMENRVPIEDDWDNASILTFKNGGIRTLTGGVWETVIAGEEYTSDYWSTLLVESILSTQYPEYDAAYGINDMTVQLIELKTIDEVEQEFLRAETLTSTITTVDAAGNSVINIGGYEFSGYIPGEYTVRFRYGDNVVYDSNPDDDINENKEISEHTKLLINGMEVNSPYNGLFYQSSKANPQVNEAHFWYADSDGSELRRSDAYDEANRRKALNEILRDYTYGDIIRAIKGPEDPNDIAEKEKYTGFAYTSMLDVYPEKAKTETGPYEQQVPGYKIDKVDFGLTPRTPSKLEIKKEVSHIKMILANGMVQFDADTQTIREQGVPAVVQAVPGSDINISMSSELVNGATLEITYTITIVNNGEDISIDIYKDEPDSTDYLAMGLYSENVQELVYYKGEIEELLTCHKETEKPEAMALVVADFIPTNLEFIRNDYTGKPVNEYWDLYTQGVEYVLGKSEETGDVGERLGGDKSELEELYYKQGDSYLSKAPIDLVDMNTQEIYESNDIVVANIYNPLITTALNAKEEVSTEIVLSKVMSSNDSSDTKAYENKVRILKIYSSDSRIQDMPLDISEEVTVTDPTGIARKYLIIGLMLLVSIIIAGGIVLIKKFIIPRR